MSQLEERCVECGTEVATIADTPLCSKECQKQYAIRMIRNMSDGGAWCPTCNKEFDSVRAVCYHHNSKHTFEVYKTCICHNCDDVFKPSSTKNDNKYCSEDCFSDATHNGFVAIECSGQLCDDTFVVEKSHANAHDPKFCSKSCSKTGVNNPSWSETTSRDIRGTPEYTQWQNNVHSSSDVCENCGNSENLQAHHKVPISEDESLATDVDNGIVLCGRCHHKNYKNMPKEMFNYE